MKYRFTFLYLFISVACFAQSLSVTISGRVVDARSREPLSFSSIAQTANGAGTFTDDDGRFSLSVDFADRNSPVSLRIYHLGYQDTLLQLGYEAARQPLMIALSGGLLLPQVDVVASSQFYGYSGTVLTPDIRKLKAMPVILGETDLLKSLLLLPGISTGLEGTANIQIRGGNPSQTHLLLDGNVLYNANHLGGFLSSVDPYGVKGITVYKGGVPARLGGRLSGVLDVSLRAGRKDLHAQELFLGTGTLRLGMEGPLGKKGGSYLVSGRYGYPNLVNKLLQGSDYERRVRGNHSSINIYDGLLKLNWDRDKSNTSFHLFSSGDDGFFQNESGFSFFSDDYTWATRALGAKHSIYLKPGLTWVSQLNISRYEHRFDAFQIINRQTIPVRSVNTQQRAVINDAALRSYLSYTISQRWEGTAGLEVNQRRLNTRIDNTDKEGDEESRREITEISQGNEWVAYAELRFSSRNKKLKIDGGLRAIQFANQRSASYLEPRIKGSYALQPRLFLNMGYDVHTQFVHQLSTDLATLPTDIWVVADSLLRPSRSQQFFIGLGGRLDRPQLTWSVEVFTKRMDQLLTLIDGSGAIFTVNDNWREQLAYEGQGDARGFELYLEKEGKRFNAWLAYTLSYSNRQFEVLNNGAVFPFTFDRRHDFSLAARYQLSEKWFASGTFAFQTGQAITLPVGFAPGFQLYDGVNNGRLSNYHRMDIAFGKKWTSKKRANRSNELSFSVYNLYNRANPVGIFIEPGSSTFTIDPNTGQAIADQGLKLVQTAVFPLVPSVSYRVNIN